MELKLIRIGNSRGIRIPMKLIERYHLQNTLHIEEREEGILIKSEESQEKLSWEESYREMAEENEDWSDFEEIVDDGIE